MSGAPPLHPDRLFAANERERDVARELYQTVKDLPIISPHGHTDPQWFAEDVRFADPAALLIKPDHYLIRLLYSRGVSLERLGLEPIDGRAGRDVEQDSRAVWRAFAENYHLFRGTPSRLWFDHALMSVFDIHERLAPGNADQLYDQIDAQLDTQPFRPRALFDRFNIEFLATTEDPLDDLRHHDAISRSNWNGKVTTTYRPDNVTNPETPDFMAHIRRLGELTGEHTETWQGYLTAHRKRRAYFIDRGATATDHGHPTPVTSDLSDVECEALYAKAIAGSLSAQEAELFRGQTMTEMAAMSIDDGLVMQIHPGVYRNHNAALFSRFGRDKGGDLPVKTDFIHALKPLLDKFGNDPRLSIILFTLDETTYARELAPLAGHYPCLTLGPPWWFHDSAEGMLRYKRQIFETAGFYNTAGFNDDTRAFLSIPARHDVARRMDCRHLAELVCDHRLDEDEAFELAGELANGLVRRAYRLDRSAP